MQPLNFRLGLWCSSVLCLALYKGIAVAPVSPFGALASLVVEAAFLAVGLGLLDAITRAAPRSERGATLAFSLLVLLTLCFSTSHAFFFASAAERRFSPLDVGLAGIWYFFRHVLPITGLLGLVATLTASVSGAVWATKRVRVGPKLVRLPQLSVVAAAFVLAFLPRVPSPIVDLVHGVVEDLRTPRLKFERGTPLPGSPLELERVSWPRMPSKPRFSRVLAFVMETMTAEQFERERKALPPESYIHALAERGVRYTRYFPSNQDSRTGMLGMLTSRLIPYEAYTESGRDHYLWLEKSPSLVDLLHAQGYETAFAVSQNEIELVVGDLPWQHVLSLDQAGVNRARRQGHLCFVPYEFEHSCEDLALLPDVLALIDQHPRLFLYQEFIWGHASEYNEATGKTNTQYYAEYLDRVVQHLREKGQLDDTLIVLTSDHGFRDTSLQGDPEVVRIPLFFHSPGSARTGLEPRTDTRLFAHMDFKNLLLHALSPDVSSPEERSFTLVVGPTGSSFVLALTAKREWMWMKADEARRLLLRHVRLGADGQPREPLADLRAPAGFLELFFQYRAHFDHAGRVTSSPAH